MLGLFRQTADPTATDCGTVTIINQPQPDPDPNPDPDPQPECSANADCSAGEVCQDGTCVTDPNAGGGGFFDEMSDKQKIMLLLLILGIAYKFAV